MTETSNTKLKQDIEGALQAARSGDFGELDALVEGLNSDNPDVRIKAAAAANRIGSPRLVGPLSHMALHDDDSPNRNQAIYALAGVGTPAVVPILIRALEDSDPERREDARTALYRLLGEDVLNQFSDEENENSDDDATGESSRMLQWWNDHSADFDEEQSYFLGEPVNPSRVVDEIERQGPRLADAYLDTLQNWTGNDFGREPDNVVSRWRRWLAERGAEYQAGRRYFYGHQVV